MTQYKVLKDFKGAARGIHVRDFVKGETVQIECEDLIAIALAEKWIAAATPAPKPKPKARPKAKTPTLSNKNAS